jgi:hypothetical protein
VVSEPSLTYGFVLLHIDANLMATVLALWTAYSNELPPLWHCLMSCSSVSIILAQDFVRV